MLAYKELNNTLFGHTSGHLIPGTTFLLFGSWWAMNLLLGSTLCDTTIRHTGQCGATGSHRARVWYRVGRRSCARKCKVPVEPFCKIIISLLGVIGEMSSAQWRLYNNKDFYMDSINNFSHATMFAFFAFSGLVDLIQYFRPTFLPKESGFVMLALAFFMEGLLFSFHLEHERTPLDKQAHVMLYGLALACSLLTILECWRTNSFVVSLGRPLLTVLQGTWFYQLAFMLYGPSRWIAFSEAAYMFVPVVFGWHVFVVLTVFLAVYLCQHRLRDFCGIGPRDTSVDAEDFVSMEQLLPGKEDEEETAGSLQSPLMQL